MATKAISVSIEYVEAYYIKGSANPTYRKTYESALEDGFDAMARKLCSAFQIEKIYIQVEGQMPDGALAKRVFDRHSDKSWLKPIFDAPFSRDEGAI